MRRLAVALAGLALAACSPGEAPVAPEAAVTAEMPAAVQPEAPPSTNIIPPQSADAPPPNTFTDMSPTDSTPACRRGLIEKGLNAAELEIMLGPMAGVCPNTGIDEKRIRDILANIWTQAGCRAHSPAEVAKTLESGACGGDAG